MGWKMLSRKAVTTEARHSGQPGTRTASLASDGPGRLRMSGRVPHTRELLRLRDEGCRLLQTSAAEGVCTLDLSGLDGAGSVPMTLILSWHRHARAEGVELRFTGVPDGLREMAAVSGLGGFLVEGAD